MCSIIIMNPTNNDNENTKFFYETTPLINSKDKYYSSVLTGTLSNEIKSKSKTKDNSTILYFVIISFAYVMYSISDGSIRTIILFHAYELNFSAFLVAVIFTFYELSSIITNLLGGVLVSLYGIKFVILLGLTFQLISFGMLFAWNSQWSQLETVFYVTLTQLFSGSAKDLIKICGKTVTKLVKLDPNETDVRKQSNTLYKIVSILTGWKNSFKGLGYFFASFSLQYTSYNMTSWVNIWLLMFLYP